MPLIFRPGPISDRYGTKHQRSWLGATRLLWTRPPGKGPLTIDLRRRSRT